MYGDTIGRTSQRRDFADTSDKRMTQVVTGAVTATYDPPRRTFSQDAFGNVLSGSSDGFHLTTKRHDSAIGLYYFCQRWYEPELGRFLTRAPLPPALEHPYVVTSNNPTTYIDPFGTFFYRSRSVSGWCNCICLELAGCTCWGKGCPSPPQFKPPPSKYDPISPCAPFNELAGTIEMMKKTQELERDIKEHWEDLPEYMPRGFWCPKEDHEY